MSLYNLEKLLLVQTYMKDDVSIHEPLYGPEDPLDVINPIVVANLFDRGSFNGNFMNYDRYNQKISYSL